MSALVAAAVVWAGVIAAEPAHAHTLLNDHAHVIHALTPDAHADHRAAFANHHHDHDVQPSDGDDGSEGRGDEGVVFHVHASPGFVSLAAEHVIFTHVVVTVTTSPIEPVLPMLTRSTAPPDRPPRFIL